MQPHASLVAAAAFGIFAGIASCGGARESAESPRNDADADGGTAAKGKTDDRGQPAQRDPSGRSHCS